MTENIALIHKVFFALPIILITLAVIVIAIRFSLRDYLRLKMIGKKRKKLVKLRETLTFTKDIDHKFVLLNRCKELEFEIELLKGQLKSVYVESADNDSQNKQNVTEFKKAS